jgi:hypothetical protein
MGKDDPEHFSEAETERRREAALKRMLATPHQPHKPLKKAEKRKTMKKDRRSK